jgi:hypothetical protein
MTQEDEEEKSPRRTRMNTDKKDKEEVKSQNHGRSTFVLPE